MNAKKLSLPSTESEITDRWLYRDKVYISIICITYNQEEYIFDAIDSFLAQETDYCFEIIIHDDASTDKTRDILLNYKNRFPSLIKLILQKENQYSQNKKPSKIAMEASLGKFLCICEGDDYFCNENKIDIQIKELINRTQNICFTKSFILKNNCLVPSMNYGDKNKIISAAKFIEIGGGACATSSIMFRRCVIDSLPKWYDSAPVGDAFLQAYASINDGAIYISEYTSIYRMMTKGSWSHANFNMDSILILLIKLEEYYDKFNQATDYKYNKDIKKLMSRKLLESSFVLIKIKSYRAFFSMIKENIIKYHKYFFYSIFSVLYKRVMKKWYM